MKRRAGGASGFDGSIVQQLREERGLSRSAFAASLGVDVDTVRQWEVGISEPAVRILPRLAAAVGVEVEDLHRRATEVRTLRDLRRRAGLTQEAVGLALGVSKSAISTAERGLSTLGSEHVPTLAQTFGVGVEDVSAAMDLAAQQAEGRSSVPAETNRGCLAADGLGRIQAPGASDISFAPSIGHVHGSLSRDAVAAGRRGWILGAFFDRSDDRHSADLEVKYGEFQKGADSNHPAKVSSTTEFTLVLSGTVRAVIGTEQVILSAGDYVLIHPGTPNNTVLEVVDDARILTVKAPSDPAAKKVLPSIGGNGD